MRLKVTIPTRGGESMDEEKETRETNVEHEGDGDVNVTVESGDPAKPQEQQDEEQRQGDDAEGGSDSE